MLHRSTRLPRGLGRLSRFTPSRFARIAKGWTGCLPALPNCLHPSTGLRLPRGPLPPPQMSCRCNAGVSPHICKRKSLTFQVFLLDRRCCRCFSLPHTHAHTRARIRARNGENICNICVFCVSHYQQATYKCICCVKHLRNICTTSARAQKSNLPSAGAFFPACPGPLGGRAFSFAKAPGEFAVGTGGIGSAAARAVVTVRSRYN